MISQVVNVVITGGAGRIAYSLIPLILTGRLFGEGIKINLRLLDIPQSLEKLKGIAFEIEDSNFICLNELIYTVDPLTAFADVEVAILLGGFPRLPGMERSDLLHKNAENIKAQAQALNSVARNNVKVLCVANPANTNCLVAIKTATNIPAQNFTCLSRLDEERLKQFVAKKVSSQSQTSISGLDISNVFILGNHSTTQVASISTGKVKHEQTVDTFFSNEEYQHLSNQVQNRGGEIIKAQQASSALSAAEAIVKHLRNWLVPNSTSSPFSMGVLGHGNPYDVPEDLVFSFPCIQDPEASCGYSIYNGLTISERENEKLQLTINELSEERALVEKYF